MTDITQTKGPVEVEGMQSVLMGALKYASDAIDERDATIAALVEALERVLDSLNNRMIGMDKSQQSALDALAKARGET